MELVEKLIKLDILYIREMERRNIIKLKNMGQLTEPLGLHSPNITILKSVEYLQNLINKNSNIQYVKKNINKLQEETYNSPIKNYKFWNGRLNEQEKELESLALKRLLFMDTCFVGIARAEEIINITQSAIKQACQQNRLLNTKKVGKTWLVHIPEIRAYWNVPDIDNKSLYKDWEY